MANNDGCVYAAACQCLVSFNDTHRTDAEWWFDDDGNIANMRLHSYEIRWCEETPQSFVVVALWWEFRLTKQGLIVLGQVVWFAVFVWNRWKTRLAVATWCQPLATKSRAGHYFFLKPAEVKTGWQKWTELIKNKQETLCFLCSGKFGLNAAYYKLWQLWPER